MATTEIGFAPWVRQDVRVMDLSGLTDRRIAERAPTADHWVIGVFEPDWNDPDAFVVREVLRRRPAVVVVSSAVDPDAPRSLGRTARHPELGTGRCSSGRSCAATTGAVDRDRIRPAARPLHLP